YSETTEARSGNLARCRPHPWSPKWRVTYLFHQNWRPEELANVESMNCSRMNVRCRSQSCDDCVDPGINGLQCPLTHCITQDASFDMKSTRPSISDSGPQACAAVVDAATLCQPARQLSHDTRVTQGPCRK